MAGDTTTLERLVVHNQLALGVPLSVHLQQQQQQQPSHAYAACALTATSTTTCHNSLPTTIVVAAISPAVCGRFVTGSKSSNDDRIYFTTTVCVAQHLQRSGVVKRWSPNLNRQHYPSSAAVAAPLSAFHSFPSSSSGSQLQDWLPYKIGNKIAIIKKIPFGVGCERRIPSEVLPIGVIYVISENFRVDLLLLIVGFGLLMGCGDGNKIQKREIGCLKHVRTRDKWSPLTSVAGAQEDRSEMTVFCNESETRQRMKCRKLLHGAAAFAAARAKLFKYT
jgi:hypothetical protein